MIDEQAARLSLDASNLAYSYGTIAGPAPGYQWIREFIDPNTGFHAQVFKNNANSYIIAFTGTEPSFQDAYTNLNLGWTQWSAGRTPLLAFLQTLGPLDQVNFTGHSLGGALAQYAAYEYALVENRAAFTLTTFNAFGGAQGIQQNIGTYDSTRLWKDKGVRNHCLSWQ